MDVAAKIDRGNDIENIKNQLVVKHSLDVKILDLSLCVFYTCWVGMYFFIEIV